MGHVGLPMLQGAHATFRRPVGVHLLEQLSSIGDESLKLVSLTAIFSGILLALQLGRFLARFGNGSGSGHVIGSLTGIGGTLWHFFS